eukprot:TRINITY_DN9792_c0_g1_i8.p1 TRINITY_DN9792_c0_g1~~TRINITY_DN9792_c0_g1_i8.p1  ORF type:complete len:310 (+),score=52.13 TRINITY_DN9792_c0_g1_i8:138-1067(+)
MENIPEHEEKKETQSRDDSFDHSELRKRKNTLSLKTANQIMSKFKNRASFVRETAKKKSGQNKKTVEKIDGMLDPTSSSEDELPRGRNKQNIARAKGGVETLKKMRKKGRRNSTEQTKRLPFLTHLARDVYQDYTKVNVENFIRVGEENEGDAVLEFFDLDDPESLLHIADYKQNQDIKSHVSLENLENDVKRMNIKVTDSFTFFRLQHEIQETHRKTSDFVRAKQTFFESGDSQKLLDYDKSIKYGVNDSDESPPLSDLIKQSEEYLRGVEIGKRIKNSMLKNKAESTEKIFNMFKRELGPDSRTTKS